MPVLLFLRALGMGVFGFLRKLEPFQLLSLALGIALLFVGAQRNGARHDRDAWHRQFTAEHKLRATDRASYEAAQRQAAEKNTQQVQRIETEQKAKTDAIQSRWDADRARLAELMRRKATPGSSQGPQASPVPGSPGGPDGAGQVCIPEGDALSAAENELKLFYLQEWIREQSQIER